MSKQKELETAKQWLSWWKKQSELFPDDPQHISAVRRYEKLITLLEHGCKVDLHQQGWLVNDKYVLVINFKKYRNKGNMKWHWYRDLAELVVSKFNRHTVEEADGGEVALLGPPPSTEEASRTTPIFTETNLNNITMEVITHAQASLELRSKKQKERDAYKQKLYQTLKSLPLEGVVKIPRNSYPYKTEPGGILNTVNMFGAEKFIYRSNEEAYYIQRVE